MAVAGITWGEINSNGYGVLPTFALSDANSNNKHTFISLVFFVVATLIEGIILAYFLDSVKEIKREFSNLPEL